MGSPTDRKYTDSHEWIMLSSPAKSGVTEYGVKQAGTITSVTLPTADKDATQGLSIGLIEGSASNLTFHSAVSGHVTDHNNVLGTTPGTINDDPYGDGWIMIIALSDTTQLNGLMTAAEYDNLYPL